MKRLTSITSVHWAARRMRIEHEHKYQAFLEVYYETRRDAQQGSISAARLAVTEYSIEEMEEGSEPCDWVNEVSGKVFWLEAAEVENELRTESSWTVTQPVQKFIWPGFEDLRPIYSEQFECTRSGAILGLITCATITTETFIPQDELLTVIDRAQKRGVTD